MKTDGFKQHVFKWGVGNKFRSINANRFTPVHHARPKEVTVREDYFESPDPAIQYDPVNEQWEVFWFEHHKLNAKPFPVKKFGVEQSKLEATKYLAELKDAGRFLAQPALPTSDVKGVFWDDRLQSWFVQDGKKVRAFSAAKHGPNKARKLAESIAKNNKSGRIQADLAEALRDAQSSHS